MNVSWIDVQTHANRRLDNVSSIEQEGSDIVLTTADRKQQETVPDTTDLFVFSGNLIFE